MRKKSWMFLMFVLPAIFSVGQEIDTLNSFVSFEVSNFRVNTVEGKLTGFEGDVLFDEQDLENSYFNVCVDPGTINTGIEMRDEHLLEEDYFDVSRHPRICFRSGSISPYEDGFLARGILKMKGIAREVNIPFKRSEEHVLWGNFEINRLDHGIGPSGGFLVGKTISISIYCAFKQD
jgi:polyisoprenoid-binding protein YceI